MSDSHLFESTETSDAALIGQTPRVICPDLGSLQAAIRRLKESKELKITKLRHDIDKARGRNPAGYRGVLIRFKWRDQEQVIQLLTFHELRWLLWARHVTDGKLAELDSKVLRNYSIAVSDYLHEMEQGNFRKAAPRSTAFNLSESADFYFCADSRELISDDSLRNLLEPVAGLELGCDSGVIALIPTKSKFESMMQNVSADTFPFYYSGRFQQACDRYFTSGGAPRYWHRLTSAAQFAELDVSEYSFCVDIEGKIYFAPSTIDASPPDGESVILTLDHSLLLPGVPVSAAGRFRIDRDTTARLIEVSSFDRSHFYTGDFLSASTGWMQESDSYFRSLSQFFAALDRLGIVYSIPLLRKF